MLPDTRSPSPPSLGSLSLASPAEGPHAPEITVTDVDAQQASDRPRLQEAACIAVSLARFIFSHQSSGGNKVLQLVVARRLAGIITRVDSDPAYVFKVATQLRGSSRRALRDASADWGVPARVATVLSVVQAMQERGLIAGHEALVVPGFGVRGPPVPRAAELHVRAHAGPELPGMLQDVRGKALLRLHKWLDASARNAVRTMFQDPEGAVQVLAAVEEEVRASFPRDVVVALFAYVAANIIKELVRAEPGSDTGELCGTDALTADMAPWIDLAVVNSKFCLLAPLTRSVVRRSRAGGRGALRPVEGRVPLLRLVHRRPFRRRRDAGLQARAECHVHVCTPPAGG